MAAIVGGWLTQVGRARPQVPAVLVYGAVAQVITGPTLVGLASSGLVHQQVDNAKVGVKLLVALAVLVVAYLGRQRDLETAAAQPAAAGAPTASPVTAAVETPAGSL